MDTLNSFLLSECFNGEKEVEESAQLNVSQLTQLSTEITTLNSQLNVSQWLGGSLQGFGKKTRGSNLNSCIFFNGKR